MTMYVEQDKWCGFVDITVSEVYENCPEFFDAYGLFITCLDSTDDVSKLEKWLASLLTAKIHYEIVGRGVFLPNRCIPLLFKQGKTFFGFDEVYLVESRPSQVPARRFTTDGTNFSVEVPEQFWKAFGAIGAKRYLADGCGLNFVCESKRLADRLELIAQRRMR